MKNEKEKGISKTKTKNTYYCSDPYPPKRGEGGGREYMYLDPNLLQSANSRVLGKGLVPRER